MSVYVEVSWGELIDKVTILQIKLDRMEDPDKVANVRRELDALQEAHGRALAEAKIEPIEEELRRVNLLLWENEDRIREWERVKTFGPGFIECARTAYRLNDQRSVLKRKINEALGSSLVEEKSYAPYD